MGLGQFMEAGEWQGMFGFIRKCNCVLGYSDFNHSMGFTSKKMQILYTFVKKVFQLVKPFLANLHSTRSQK
jgi:hypothetical protein